MKPSHATTLFRSRQYIVVQHGARTHIAEQRRRFIWIHFMRRRISKCAQFWPEQNQNPVKREWRPHERMLPSTNWTIWVPEFFLSDRTELPRTLLMVGAFPLQSQPCFVGHFQRSSSNFHTQCCTLSNLTFKIWGSIKNLQMKDSSVVREILVGLRNKLARVEDETAWSFQLHEGWKPKHICNS